ncbi:MAG TPA: type II toxin-antitoxin system HigB family toxin [Sphingomonas sp.]|nr:type II toxin-antitoxin system HigB family toxin [Sphingomonas sp.]
MLSRSALRKFWETPNRGDSEEPLQAWYLETTAAAWKTPADIKEKYRSASFVGDNRVIFNIAGNKYRLVVHVIYAKQRVLIKFIGTHEEYDAISAETVGGGKK